MNIKKNVILPLIIIIAGVAVFQLLHVTKPEPEKKESTARPLSLFVAPARAADKILNVTVTGEVRARSEIDLVAQVSGRIVYMSDQFSEGGQIGPDQVLIKIDDRDYKVAVAGAEARVAAAEVTLEQALADADVAEKQLRGFKNPSPLALKKPQVGQARAALKAAQAELQRAQLDLERTNLSVPFEGRVKTRRAGLGQFVTPGTSLGKVFATDQVEVRLSLTDKQLHSLGKPMGYISQNPEDAPNVLFTNSIAGEQHHWKGYLKSIDAAVDNSTRTIYALAVLDNPYQQDQEIPMAVGMYVEAQISGRNVSQATLISAAGLRAGNIVYTVENGLLRKHEVKVGYQDNDFALIEEGVLPGQDVVVSPIRNPIDGMAAEGRQLSASEMAGSIVPASQHN